MHGILERAKKKKWISVKPMDDMEGIDVDHSGKIEVLGPDEVLTIANAANTDQDRALIIVAAFTGLRLGELRALRWGDVDWGSHAIRVRESYTNGVTNSPKSGKVRTPPLMEDAARELEHLSHREYFTGDDDFVFCSHTGEHRGARAMREALYNAMDNAGFQRLRNPREGQAPFRFHDLRHHIRQSGYQCV